MGSQCYMKYKPYNFKLFITGCVWNIFNYLYMSNVQRKKGLCDDFLVSNAGSRGQRAIVVILQNLLFKPSQRRYGKQ